MPRRHARWFVIGTARHRMACPSRRTHAADRLAALVRANGYRIGTGFLGISLICDALAERSHLNTACRLLLQQ